MHVDLDLEKAAGALLAQYGDRAVRVAEERATRHAIAKETAASEMWHAIADALKRRALHPRS